jgi:hypothetical protein
LAITSDLDARDHALGLRGGDGKAHLAVVDEKRVARLDAGEDLRMRQVGARRIAFRRVAVEDERVAGLHRGRPALERAKAQLRPLKIDQDPDRPVIVTLDAADHGDDLAHAVG